jgi:hypothetical protein
VQWPRGLLGEVTRNPRLPVNRVITECLIRNVDIDLGVDDLKPLRKEAAVESI